MQPDFDKANEIYFRLGIIYKQQQKYNQSLEVHRLTHLNSNIRLHVLQCFKYIVSNPPRPLTEEDIWFQVGHVHEQQKDVRFLACQSIWDSILCIYVVRLCESCLPTSS